MKFLSNPCIKYEGYNCFGCSPRNPIGLKMLFTEEDDYLFSEWTPELHYQGYHNVLHGGIQATLMDEIATWTIFVKADMGGVTAKIEIKYRKPVYIHKGKIQLKSRLLETKKRTARVKVELFSADNILCTEAFLDYFLIHRDMPFEGIVIPEKEAFYE